MPAKLRDRQSRGVHTLAERLQATLAPDGIDKLIGALTGCAGGTAYYKGRRFDPGCAPSPEVAEAAERLARQLADVCSPLPS